jgi:hypothetical protein
VSDRRALRFWASAAACALAFAAAARLLLPYEMLRIESDAERHRAWLLTLWTAGVFAVLFGTSALLGAFRGIGFRDVHDAGGSVLQAMDTFREGVKRSGAEPFHGSFAWWLVSTGMMLVLIYFTAWALG